MSCKLNFKNKTIKAMVLGSVLLSVPMWGLIANAAEFPLIIKRADTGPCDYNNFEVDSNGALILNLVDSSQCNLIDAIKDSRTGTGVDSDEDGFSDLVELYAGTNINNANDKPNDLDGDGTPDAVDSDRDGDGFNNDQDAFPDDPDKHVADPDDPPPTASGPLERETDIVNKFNTAYPSYTTKAGLGPRTVNVNGINKTVYIVNQGNIATSVPSCVNGVDPQTGCSPVNWALGAKKNEIYSVRLKRNPAFPIARIRVEKNQKANGVATNANYKYHISDKPGDMIGRPYGDGNFCEVSTVDFSGSISIRDPAVPLSFDLHCDIPSNETFYLNIELEPDAFAACKVVNGVTTTDPLKPGICCDDQNTTCSNYFITNSLAVPTSLQQGLPQ